MADTVTDDLARAHKRIEDAGRTAGELLLHCKDDPEAVSLLHRLIGQQGLVLNSIRFAQRSLTR